MRHLTALGLALAAFVSGCQNYPRNGDQLEDPNQAFAWTGHVTRPGDRVRFQVYDHNRRRFVDRAQANSSTSAYRDGAGTNWYAFSRNVTAPWGFTNYQYWDADPWTRSTGNQRKTRIRVRSDGDGDGLLTNFDNDAETNECMQTNSNSGVAILSNCSSAASPVTTLEVECGKADQWCCLSHEDSELRDGCDRGHRCHPGASRCTLEAGGHREYCEADGTCDGLGVCVPGIDRCGTLVENAFAHRIVLRVHTASLSHAQSRGRVSVQLNGEKFSITGLNYNSFKNNTTQEFTIVPTDVLRVKDITQLRLENHTNDGWAFDRIELEINGENVFTRSMSPTWIDGDGSTAVYQVPGIALRADPQWNRLDERCDIPTHFEGSDLQKAFTAVVGNAVATEPNIGWGDEGRVRVGRADNGRDLLIYIKLRVQGGGLAGYVSQHIRLEYDCIEDEKNCSGGTNQSSECELITRTSLGGEPGGFRVHVGNPSFDTRGLASALNVATLGLFESLADDVLDAFVQVGTIYGRDALGSGDDFVIGLAGMPVCPDVTVEDDGSVAVDWTVDRDRLPQELAQWLPTSPFDLSDIGRAMCFVP